MVSAAIDGVLSKGSQQLKAELQRYNLEIEGYKSEVKLMKQGHEKAQREAARVSQVSSVLICH